MRVGRSAAFPDGPAAETGCARADGDPVSPRRTAAPRCRRSTTASASRSWRGSIRPIALSVAAHNGLCASHLYMFGSEAQKRQYLPRLVQRRSARRVGPHRSRRRQRCGRHADHAPCRQGDCWVINGAKTFITHGAIGGVIVVMAVTDRAKGHRGISAFVLEHGTPGMSAGQEGEQARDARERHERGDLPGLPRAGVADGRRGGAGLHQHAAGARRRPHRDCGARRSASRRARTRRRARLRQASAGSSASRIAAFQAIQWKLADNATRIEAARLLTYRAAYLKDHGPRARRASPPWRSSTRAKSPSAPPTTACRFMAATGS